MEEKEESCFNCANYVTYHHSTGNIVCRRDKKNEIVQFGFGDLLPRCSKYRKH